MSNKDDERLRKTAIAFLKDFAEQGYENAVECIDWLEKQGKQEQIYIRFGEIPIDEKSKIYRGEIEVGIENGVSVYPAFKTNEGNIVLGLNLPITKTTLHTQQHLIEYDNRPCYLVNGDYIGKDTDGQPLIKNVSIIEKIDNYKVKEKIGNIDNQNYIKPIDMDKSKFLENDWLGKQGEQNLPSVNERAWLYLVSDVLTWKDGIGQYLDDPRVQELAKILCSKYAQKLYNPSNTVNNEQKSADKIEPRFKVGDWVTVNKSCQIININDKGNYIIQYCDDENTHELSKKFCESHFHLWTIQDAKDGDVIHLGTVTAIFKKYIGQEKCICYCSFCKDVDFEGFEIPIENGDDNVYGCYNATPATKEQRDTIMKAMNDAGYEWDSKNKKLICITLHI